MGGRQGRESRLNKEQQDQLVQQATQGNFHTIGEAAKWVEQTYGVHYTYFGMRSLVERLRLKKKVPRPIGAKASMEAQEAWKRGASEQFA